MEVIILTGNVRKVIAKCTKIIICLALCAGECLRALSEPPCSLWLKIFLHGEHEEDTKNTEETP